MACDARRLACASVMCGILIERASESVGAASAVTSASELSSVFMNFLLVGGGIKQDANQSTDRLVLEACARRRGGGSRRRRPLRPPMIGDRSRAGLHPRRGSACREPPLATAPRPGADGPRDG